VLFSKSTFGFEKGDFFNFFVRYIAKYIEYSRGTVMHIFPISLVMNRTIMTKMSTYANVFFEIMSTTSYLFV
jgi:hypothetical protein